MTVHQVSRFCENPKHSPEQGICQIMKYLKGTRDKGTVAKPNKVKEIQCFIDADFAGGFNKEVPEDPSTVVSRTRYTIKYKNCPILWVSKLQQDIALGMTKSEYVALSMVIRDVIPLLNLVDEVKAFLPIKTMMPVIKCKVFKDNQSCMKVAKAPMLTPRMKHIAI